MRIWSIQSIEAWAYLQRHGRLEARPEHVAGDWPHAYNWMREQLVRRVGLPPEADSQPLWGWFQWHSATKKRPDFRTLRHLGSKQEGEIWVMIECELPDQDVLLSDFEAWHIPLNDGYLGLNDHDCDRFDYFLKRTGWERGDPIPDPFLTEQRKSWELIFDLDALNGDFWGCMEKKSIQACFWQVRLDQVKSAKPFRVKQRKR